MSEKIVAQAQPVTPTADETVTAAPASGIETQDTDLTGSGEVVRQIPVADRDRPEDIESPEEWLKNAEKINSKITSEIQTEGEQPPVEATEATTTPETSTPIEAAAAATTLAAPAPAEDDGAEETGKARVRLNRANFKTDDDYKIAVKGTKLMNEFGLTPAAAETEARRLLGINAPETASTTTQAPIPRTDGKPSTIADTDVKIAELRAQRKQAFTVEADLEKADALDTEISNLQDHKRDLKDESTRATADAATRQRQGFDSEVVASQAKTVELYPDTTNKDSALSKAMFKIDANWKARNHPDFNSANKPLLLAQEAADLLGIAPKTPGTTPATPAAASPQPVKPVRPVQPAAPVASGAARTTPAATPQSGQLVEKLNKITSPADYEAALTEMTGKRY